MGTLDPTDHTDRAGALDRGGSDARDPGGSDARDPGGSDARDLGGSDARDLGGSDAPGDPGDRIHAVLTPPDLRRFRELTGVGDTPLEAGFDGWSKLAVFGSDRVFLFPRYGREADLLHGADVCEALVDLGVPYAPRVLGRWPAGTLEATGPFVAFERRPGTGWPRLEDNATLDECAGMLRTLGQAIASWHRVDVAALPSGVRLEQPRERGSTWLARLLDPDALGPSLQALGALLDGTPSAVTTWRHTLEPLTRLDPVLVHGDVCENQLIVDERLEVRTVLDWDTAAIGHPLYDFDFGEWGTAIFAWERDFARLRAAIWDGYRAGRTDLDLPSAAGVHLLFTLAEAAYHVELERAGRLDDWAAGRLAILRPAVTEATDALGSDA